MKLKKIKVLKGQNYNWTVYKIGKNHYICFRNFTENVYNIPKYAFIKNDQAVITSSKITPSYYSNLTKILKTKR